MTYKLQQHTSGYTNQTAAELAKAVKSIINTDVDKTCPDYIIVSNKEDAETISQLFLDAGEGGLITGPFLQPVNGTPQKVWNVSTT